MNNNILLPIFEEYKTLRTESIESIKGQQSTLRIGTATIAILVVSGFNLWDKPILPHIMFLLFIPFTSYLSLIIWIGEVARMMRVGFFLSKIEDKVNIYFKEENLISWENWLRTQDLKGKTNQMKLNYLAIVALFFATALASIFIGNFGIWHIWSLRVKILINVFESISFTIVLLIILKTGKRFKSS